MYKNLNNIITNSEKGQEEFKENYKISLNSIYENYSLKYLYQGKYFTIPLRERSVRPFIDNWVLSDFKFDEQQIKLWSEQYPNGGIGLPTGKVNNVLVLNVHNFEKISEIEKQYSFKFSVPCIKTDREYFYFFKYPENVEVRNKYDAKSFEIYSDGRYVVLPPSLSYEWVDKLDLPSMDNSRLSELPPKLLSDISESFSASFNQKETTDTGSCFSLSAPFKHKDMNYKELRRILNKKKGIISSKNNEEKTEKKVKIPLTKDEKNYLKKCYKVKIEKSAPKLFNKLSLCEKHIANLHEEKRSIILHKCRSKFCFKCQHNRSVFNQAVLDEYVNNRESNEYLKMLTLTTKNVKNVEDVKKNYEALQRCWAGLLKLWRKRKYKLDFYIRAFEVTYSRKTGYHLHFHVFLDSQFIDIGNINKDWRRLGKENNIKNEVTYINAIKFNDWKNGEYEHITQIFKYIMKDEFSILLQNDANIEPFVKSLYQKKQYIIGGKKENKKLWKKCVKETKEKFEELAKEKQTGYTKEYVKIYNPKTKYPVDLGSVTSLETVYQDIYDTNCFRLKEKCHYYFEIYDSLVDVYHALRDQQLLQSKGFPLKSWRINYFQFVRDENGKLFKCHDLRVLYEICYLYLFWVYFYYFDLFNIFDLFKFKFNFKFKLLLQTDFLLIYYGFDLFEYLNEKADLIYLFEYLNYYAKKSWDVNPEELMKLIDDD